MPRYVTSTNYPGIGKTVEEVMAMYQMMRDLEDFGAYLAKNRRLQDERIAAFGKYLEVVRKGSFPDSGSLIELDPKF